MKNIILYLRKCVQARRQILYEVGFSDRFDNIDEILKIFFTFNMRQGCIL